MAQTDILFITQIALPRDIGAEHVYESVRLRLDNTVASLPVLRKLAAEKGPAGLRVAEAAQTRGYGIPPVLTPIYLREYMRKRGVHLTDIACLETDMQQVKEAIASGVRLIAFTTTWLPIPHSANYLRKAIAEVRALAPHIPIVVGGVGVRKGLIARKASAEGKLEGVTPEQLADEYVLMDAMLDMDISAVVVGEGGEETLAEMAKRLRAGQDCLDLPNLAIPTKDGYRFTPEESTPINLDDEIVDWSRYTERLEFHEAPIRTAVGCPFQCNFCDFAPLYKPNLRSIPSLLNELRTLSSSMPAPRRVVFADDNVAISRKHLTEFTRALVAEDMQLSWRGFIRADSVDEETAELLRTSGCRDCYLGIESGDPEILANMNKRLDPEQALSAVELLGKNGINTHCTFVVGFPGECARSIERTASLISSFPSGNHATAIHRYNLFRFQVWPVSPVSSTVQRKRFKLEGFGEQWSHSTMDSEEAVCAMRDLFLQVDGPSHTYIEHVPSDWSIAKTRRVMEFRDVVKKAQLTSNPSLKELESRLLEMVQD